MVNRIWPAAVAGEADMELTLSASACHMGGPNSVNPGQILLVYCMSGTQGRSQTGDDKNILKNPFHS